MRARQKSSSSRPRWPRGLVGISFLLLVAVLATVLVFRRIPNPARAATALLEVQSAHGASFVPALEGKKPLFILAIGSDARPGERVDRLRADSIHLIGINSARRRATILGFPRDSWVNIPGRGTAKINEAMSTGGPELLVETVERITGIRIDFWLLASFRGVIRMVDEIGGLTVRVRVPMHDIKSGSNFDPGLERLNGKEALAFARDRHSFIDGDFSRSANQGRLLLAALAKLGSSFDRNPDELLRWMAIGWNNVHTDLRFSTLLDLALTATRISQGKVTNLVVPATVGSVGDISVVFIAPSAQSVFADLRRDGVIR
jgi:LCP family protein required for cell wall assembly